MAFENIWHQNWFCEEIGLFKMLIQSILYPWSTNCIQTSDKFFSFLRLADYVAHRWYTVKLGYNEQLGASHFCSLQPGFVLTGAICVLKCPIWLKNLLVITECSLTTEFVITEFHCSWSFFGPMKTLRLPHLNQSLTYRQYV